MGRALLPAIVGHRGAAAGAPENTLESLRLAADQGAAMVEFDVKLTSDGALILMHDEDLDRTTTGRGPVAATALADIRGLDAGGWFADAWRGARVPTLEAVIGLLEERGITANIEIKPCPGREEETARAVVDCLKRRWPSKRAWPLLSSFARDSLAEARDAAPEIPRGLLLWGKPADWSAAARSLDCVTVHCAKEDMTPEWAAEIGRLGYGLAVYTVNDPDLAGRLRNCGQVEALTANLVAINRRYKAHAGLRITDI